MWWSLACCWEPAPACQSCHLINCTYPELKEDSRDSEAGIWAKSLLILPQLTPAKKNMHAPFQTGCACFPGCILTPWMFTLTVGFLRRLFSLLLFFLSNRSSAGFESPNTPCYGHLLFHDIHVLTLTGSFGSVSVKFPLFYCNPKLSPTTWNLLSALLFGLTWKLKHRFISIPLSGNHSLTLSRRDPGFINSPGISRGIYMAIFPGRNYQSGDCNHGMS